ncbi:MAG TPA: hypothetical protein PLM79_03965 [Syntrophobacteraceae bacterium]|nr:hypothetical protein [Syntrophobacteraceae bacterium]
MDWFFHQPHALTLLQILLDVLLILFLACLFFRRFRRDRNVEELTRSFGKIVEETQRIAAEFETNLQERRQLIQQFLAKLDQQLERAQLMSLKLEALQNQGPLPPPHGSPPQPRASQNDQILQLARKGMDATSIARHLQKPVGEVELVLKLQTITGKR